MSVDYLNGFLHLWEVMPSDIQPYFTELREADQEATRTIFSSSLPPPCSPSPSRCYIPFLPIPATYPALRNCHPLPRLKRRVHQSHA